MRAAIAILCALLLLPSSALTLHRSFRPRQFGFGGGTGVSVPIDSRISDALDEAAAKEAARTKVVVGKATRVVNGNTICVVTDGNVKFEVLLDRIEAREKGQPIGKEAAAYLSKLIRGRTVRVEWVRKDARGRLVGNVYLGKTDVNLSLVKAGFACLSDVHCP